MASRGKIMRSTAQQLNELVDYMSTNHAFAVGEFTGPLGAQRIETEWAQLRHHLANFGPDKTIDEWKHTWRDLKKKACDDGGQVRLALNTTGNAVPVPELSERTHKILAIIGPECAMGIAVEQESGVGDASVDVRAAVSPEAFQIYEEDNLQLEEVIVEIEEPASMADDVPAPVRARAPRPRAPRARTTRPRVCLTQTPSAAFISAQRDTNRILQDISNQLQHQQPKEQQIWVMRHKRRAQGGGIHKLTF